MPLNCIRIFFCALIIKPSKKYHNNIALKMQKNSSNVPFTTYKETYAHFNKLRLFLVEKAHIGRDN